MTPNNYGVCFPLQAKRSFPSVRMLPVGIEISEESLIRPLEFLLQNPENNTSPFPNVVWE